MEDTNGNDETIEHREDVDEKHTENGHHRNIQLRKKVSESRKKQTLALRKGVVHTSSRTLTLDGKPATLRAKTLVDHIPYDTEEELLGQLQNQLQKTLVEDGISLPPQDVEPPKENELVDAPSYNEDQPPEEEEREPRTTKGHRRTKSKSKSKGSEAETTDAKKKKKKVTKMSSTDSLGSVNSEKKEKRKHRTKVKETIDDSSSASSTMHDIRKIKYSDFNTSTGELLTSMNESRSGDLSKSESEDKQGSKKEKGLMHTISNYLFGKEAMSPDIASQPEESPSILSDDSTQPTTLVEPEQEKKKKKKKKRSSTESSVSVASENNSIMADGNPFVMLLPVSLNDPLRMAEMEQVMLYRGKDDHIHMLSSTNDVDWVHVNVSQMAKTPPTSGDPTGFYRSIGNSIVRYVVYKASDDCLYQLSSPDGGKSWTHTNLSQLPLTVKTIDTPIPQRSAAVKLVTDSPSRVRRFSKQPGNDFASSTLFKIKAHIGGGPSTVIEFKCDMGTKTVEDLTAEVLKKFSEPTKAEEYTLVVPIAGKNVEVQMLDHFRLLSAYEARLKMAEFNLELIKLGPNARKLRKMNSLNGNK